MSLSFPSRIGDQASSSREAEENVNKLLYVDRRGGKEQIATRAALECFAHIKELRPSYFEGIRSWAKSGVVYLAAGTASIGALAGAGYGVYKMGEWGTDAGYGPHLLGASLILGGICKWLEFKPVHALAGLLVITVRDSADRAARSSIKKDERSWDIKEKEAQESHKEILNQLIHVYNDCAKYLTEKYEISELKDQTDMRLELKELADNLSKRFEDIEILMQQIDLGKHEIEIALQRMKDKVRFIQTESCRLQTKPGSEKANAELITRWPKDAMGEIAVPFAIRERIAAAKRCHFGIFQQAKGYASAAFQGMATLVGSIGAIGLVSAGVHAYQNGLGSTAQKAKALWENCDWADPKALNGWRAAAAVGVIVPTTAVTVQKIRGQTRAIKENDEYVKGELRRSAADLKKIYKGIHNHIAHLPAGSSRYQMQEAIRQRIPLIRHEIQHLGIVEDPSEILG